MPFWDRKVRQMSENSNLANGLAIVSGSRTGLRHPDGSIDIAAYARIAHRDRDAAIASTVRKAARTIRAIASAVWRALGRPGRTGLNAPLRG